MLSDPPSAEPYLLCWEISVLTGAQRAALTAAAAPLAVTAGATLFETGDACTGLALVLSGAVWVESIAPGRRRILLYRVKPGQICPLSVSCLMSGSRYVAKARAESDLKEIVLPRVHSHVVTRRASNN